MGEWGRRVGRAGGIETLAKTVLRPNNYTVVPTYLDAKNLIACMIDI